MNKKSKTVVTLAVSIVRAVVSFSVVNVDVLEVVLGELKMEFAVEEIEIKKEENIVEF